MKRSQKRVRMYALRSVCMQAIVNIQIQIDELKIVIALKFIIIFSILFFVCRTVNAICAAPLLPGKWLWVNFVFMQWIQVKVFAIWLVRMT